MSFTTHSSLYFGFKICIASFKFWVYRRDDSQNNPHFFLSTRICGKKSSGVLLYGKKVKTCYAELVENNQYQQSWVDESNT